MFWLRSSLDFSKKSLDFRRNICFFYDYKEKLIKKIES